MCTRPTRKVPHHRQCLPRLHPAATARSFVGGVVRLVGDTLMWMLVLEVFMLEVPVVDGYGSRDHGEGDRGNPVGTNLDGGALIASEEERQRFPVDGDRVFGLPRLGWR